MLAFWLRLTTGCGRPSSSSQRCGLILPVSRQVVSVHHPRPPSVTSFSQRHIRSWSAIPSSHRRGLIRPSQRYGRYWPAILNNNRHKGAAASAVGRRMIRGTIFTPTNANLPFPKILSQQNQHYNITQQELHLQAEFNGAIDKIISTIYNSSRNNQLSQLYPSTHDVSFGCCVVSMGVIPLLGYLYNGVSTSDMLTQMD